MVRKRTFKMIGAWLLTVFLAACSTVPITGRQQLDLVPSGQILAMSADQYQNFMAQHEVITGTEDSRMVKRVGERIKEHVRHFKGIQLGIQSGERSQCQCLGHARR